MRSASPANHACFRFLPAGRQSFEARSPVCVELQFRRRLESEGLGDIAKALEYLKKARDERCDYLVHLSKEPAADPIRNTELARLIPSLGVR